jgi:hypothetical protein
MREKGNKVSDLKVEEVVIEKETSALMKSIPGWKKAGEAEVPGDLNRVK